MCNVKTAKTSEPAQVTTNGGAAKARFGSGDCSAKLVFAYAHHGHAVPLFASVVPHSRDYAELDHGDVPNDDPSSLNMPMDPLR